MNHIMVDLETMGTRAGCAIASIGAVKFDPDADPSGLGISLPSNRFHIVVDLQTCINAKLRIDAGTLYWWLKQSREAREGITHNDRFPLAESLRRFTTFVAGTEFLWGHGASFDQPILETAYFAAKQTFPFPYWNHRDTRTIFDLTGVKVVRDALTHHNALSDAEAQAFAVLEAYSKLKGRK